MIWPLPQHRPEVVELAGYSDRRGDMTSVEVRDPVHGLVQLLPHEWDVVDSVAFQRLRRVQQLAMTHLVYPGARHSRFEHCIGACHVGAGLADAINRGQGEQVIDVRKVRAAALCHDLGHGPFSHVSESVYEILTAGHNIHEKISAGIVRHHNAIRQALGEETAEWVAQLLEGSGHGTERSIERDIVAGPADVDKLDYLLRDSHFCGVNYGRFDIHKVVESARRGADETGSVLAFHRDGIYAVEELLLARHHMHRQVYGHKTRVATDQMLIRAMIFGVEEGLLPQDVFAPPIDIDADYVSEYLVWDDSAVINRLAPAPESSRAGQVMRALMERRLLRRSIDITLEDLKREAGQRLAVDALLPQSLARDAVADAEEQIAEASGMEPLWVSLHWENLQSPLRATDPSTSDDKLVYIVDDHGRMENLEDVSEIFGQPSVGGKQTVAVYLRPNPETWNKALEESVKEVAVAAVIGIAQAARRPRGGTQ
jgi:HD superfamily phosphohydrolase